MFHSVQASHNPNAFKHTELNRKFKKNRKGKLGEKQGFMRLQDQKQTLELN